MSIITKPLPDCIFCGGKSYRLKTDFRVWIEFEKLMQDESLSPSVKAKMTCDLCFEEPPPCGAALDKVLEFYQGDKPKGKGKSRAVLSFEQDASLIYAAFYAQYGIDLSEASLHWHKFKALFAGLKEDNMLVKVMQIRSVDLSKIKDKSQKAYYRRMKKHYRLEKENADPSQALGMLFEGVDK